MNKQEKNRPKRKTERKIKKVRVPKMSEKIRERTREGAWITQRRQSGYHPPVPLDK